MNPLIGASLRHTVARFALLLLAACLAIPASASDSAALQARFAALLQNAAAQPFDRPLVMESAETPAGSEGEIYAVVPQPYAAVAKTLHTLDHWCDILILHVNVKGCRIAHDAAPRLVLSVGKKHDQPLADAYAIDFGYRSVAFDPDYLKAELSAADGPMGTRDFRIVLEAAPSGEHSLIHLSYTYGYGMAARMAMQAYLATIARDKIGFSVTRHEADGTPVYVRGMRGLVERNTMRYYLAIESYLDAARLPPAQQLERRLHEWHASTDRYARQLHELDQPEYLAMKRKEIARQARQRSG